MATIKVQRKATAVGSTLPYGELGIANNEFYFGNSSNSPIRVAKASELGSYLPLTGGTLSNTLYISKAMIDGTTTAFFTPHLKLKATNAVDNTGYVGMTFATSSTDNYGFSLGALRSTNGAGSLIIRSHTSSLQGYEWMRITSDGKVGIGTTTPISNLDVNGPVAIESKVKLDYNATTESLDFIFV